jgi:hypothetical protein
MFLFEKTNISLDPQGHWGPDGHRGSGRAPGPDLHGPVPAPLRPNP